MAPIALTGKANNCPSPSTVSDCVFMYSEHKQPLRGGDVTREGLLGQHSLRIARSLAGQREGGRMGK